MEKRKTLFNLDLNSLSLPPHPHPKKKKKKKQLFKPAQAFFGGGSSSGSGSAASTSAVSAAAAAASVPTPAAAAAAPPQFGFAASAPASASAVAAAAARVPPKPVSPPPKKAAAGVASASPIKKKRVPRGPTAYALFLKEQLSAVPAGDARSFAQRSAAVAAAWKELPASSRARFEAASQAAKASLPPRESKPAKALSGYQLFVREKLPTLRDESVAGGAGAVSAMRAAAAAWSAAPAQVKAEFAARAKAMGTKR